LFECCIKILTDSYIDYHTDVHMFLLQLMLFVIFLIFTVLIV